MPSPAGELPSQAHFIFDETSHSRHVSDIFAQSRDDSGPTKAPFHSFDRAPLDRGWTTLIQCFAKKFSCGFRIASCIELSKSQKRTCWMSEIACLAIPS